MTRAGRSGDDESAGDGVRSEPRATTRRAVLRATAAAGAGLAVGSAVVGSGTATGIPTPPLVRCGNELRDPTGQPVILRGVNVADPGRQLRPARSLTAAETIAEALDPAVTPPSDAAVEDGVTGWHPDVIRLPVQPQDVYAGTGNGGTDPASAMPHGDPWGPVLPGETGASPAPITDATLREYFEEIVDPLIDQIERGGAYAMIAYTRDYPVYHQVDRDWDQLDNSCTSTSLEWTQGGCGERGVLWHGADQIEAVMANRIQRYRHDSSEDAFTEPRAVAEALDAEVKSFWSFVADRYADRDHVLFDLYAHPTGPFEWKWGAPTRVPSVGDSVAPPEPAENRIWWDLWRDRAQPWVDVVDEHAPGSVASIGAPEWSRYTYHAPDAEFDGGSLQVCYSGRLYMDAFDAPLHYGRPAENVPVVFSEFGWAEGGGPEDREYLAGTTDEGRERFGVLFDEYPIHPIAANFDARWESAFFESPGADTGDDESLTSHLYPWETRPGQWWMRWLYEHRSEDAPSTGTGSATCADSTPGPVGPNVAVPSDPDGDGLYEDVNGNDRQDIADAVDLFRHRQDVDPRYFDFNDSGGVSIGDAVSLFRENTG